MNDTNVVCLDEITGKDLASANTTVVRALGTGETHLGPAEDLSVGVEEGVLLLEANQGSEAAAASIVFLQCDR